MPYGIDKHHRKGGQKGENGRSDQEAFLGGRPKDLGHVQIGGRRGNAHEKEHQEILEKETRGLHGTQDKHGDQGQKRHKVQPYQCIQERLALTRVLHELEGDGAGHGRKGHNKIESKSVRKHGTDALRLRNGQAEDSKDGSWEDAAHGVLLYADIYALLSRL